MGCTKEMSDSGFLSPHQLHLIEPRVTDQSLDFNEKRGILILQIVFAEAFPLPGQAVSAGLAGEKDLNTEIRRADRRTGETM